MLGEESCELVNTIFTLIGAQGDQDAESRRGAAQALGNMKNPLAVEALILALGDMEDSVVNAAVVALAKIGGPRAVEALMGALENENQLVKLAAARALGYRGTEDIGQIVELNRRCVEAGLNMSLLYTYSETINGVPIYGCLPAMLKAGINNDDVISILTGIKDWAGNGLSLASEALGEVISTISGFDPKDIEKIKKYIFSWIMVNDFRENETTEETSVASWVTNSDYFWSELNSFNYHGYQLSLANMLSLGESVCRFNASVHRGITAADIEASTREVFNQLRTFMDAAILDHDTTLITLADQGSGREAFASDIKALDNMAMKSGVSNIHDCTDAENFFNQISAPYTGKRTIWYSGHGAKPSIFNLFDYTLGTIPGLPLNPRNLANALMASVANGGNLDDTTLVLDCCYSGNFLEELYKNLQEQGATGFPRIITSSNRGDVSWGTSGNVINSLFLKALNSVSESFPEGSPITGMQFMQVEAMVQPLEDPVFRQGMVQVGVAPSNNIN
ncbi:MAG: HEAT repeat domain-containing protein [Candidatus Omnitrophica bacterium]|nr:HEAT repeat domain-containing protein [Candidatus Omnitrophota bacterium]